MDHPLEAQYGLTAYELLTAVNKRFRLKVALEGAVAEVQMEKKIYPLVGNVIERYEAHDLDGHPDFSIWIPGRKKPLLPSARMSATVTKPTATRGRLSPTWPRRRRLAHQRATPQADTTVWTSLIYSASAWGRKPATGRTSYSFGLWTCYATRSIRASWPSCSGCPYPMQRTSHPGIMTWVNY